MPNDFDHQPKLDFTTLEVRIIEHLVSASIAERASRRQALLKRPTTRTRESDAEFEMGIEPLRQMRDKIAGWLNARRGQ